MTQWVKNPPAMQEMQFQSPGQEDPLEEGHGSRSSVLALRILWIEGSGRLQSIGSQRIVKLLSCAQLFAILWSVAYQTPLSMEFS